MSVCSVAYNLHTVTFWLVNHVPRSSHCRLLVVCKNGVGRPGTFYHMNDVSVYLGRQRGGGVPNETTHRKNKLEALSYSSLQVLEFQTFVK